MMQYVIIDDNPDDREWLADMAYRRAASRAKAFADVATALANGEPSADALLLDCRLDHAHGVNSTNDLSQFFKGATHVSVTGSETLGMPQFARQYGCNYLSKQNLNADSLMNALR